MRPLVRAFALLALALPGLACLTPGADGPAGEPVGSFVFEAQLEANECGAAAVPAMDPFTYRAELRRDEGMAIWRRPDAPVVYGTIDTEDTWTLSTTTTIPVWEPDPTTGDPGCALDQTETLSFRVVEGEGSPDAATTQATRVEGGTQEIRFIPSIGTNCSAALRVTGGPFDTLPCSVRYTFDAEPTAPLFD
ncbi:MAG TPA: hypothetical protein RMH85_02485 [Polyangiaceae bacterium LLY-WYZ-15_(1-7)]|nr:hypothetical protein [Sandaracinus sp.]HJL04547.1 hypothetical protein [Polyangiaceae bacterium LLY-WYZ-15_(1-7)]MBJ70950.1 hypothetical protein [Sandaracinus sp.]HJL07329.1 hypothetical protein [Polyangiaceae bacterium LLY-WYZ-15_(1-7)]HJL27216.1 hypothetical protein [Polyangiaceae bacterium LLY-WYZ-15_(1-7)]